MYHSETLFLRLMNSKQCMNSLHQLLILEDKTCMFYSLHGIFLAMSELGECGAENMVICPQLKCNTKPGFVMPVGLCIED